MPAYHRVKPRTIEAIRSVARFRGTKADIRLRSAQPANRGKPDLPPAVPMPEKRCARFLAVMARRSKTIAARVRLSYGDVSPPDRYTTTGRPAAAEIS